MSWEQLLMSLGLVLVIEGILPFANPTWFRRRMVDMSRLDDRRLRVIGGICMLAGLFVIYAA